MYVIFNGYMEFKMIKGYDISNLLYVPFRLNYIRHRRRHFSKSSKSKNERTTLIIRGGTKKKGTVNNKK